MSEEYNLVLGRDLTCGAQVRRKYYRYMVAYLIFAGAVLVEGVYRIAKRLEAVGDASCSELAQNGVLPTDVLDQTIRVGEKNDATLKSLISKAKSSIPFMPVLFEVQKALPPGVEVEYLDMARDEFEIGLIFYDRSGVTPESYLAQWRKNEALSEYLEYLNLVDRKDGRDESGTWVRQSCVAVLRKR